MSSEMAHAMDYDDERELDKYIRRNRRFFRTPLEEEAELLGMMREKARYLIREKPAAPPAWATEMLQEYNRCTDDTIEIAIGDDLDSFTRFQQQVSDRIEAAFSMDELRPNRCPACEQIVMTPEAGQCLWCKHDWHRPPEASFQGPPRLQP